jgi:dihydroorotate dehydrogenase
MAAYESFRSLLFKLDPEAAHDLTLSALRSLPSLRTATHYSELETTVCGLKFPSPVGLAAGFDKDAKAPNRMFRFGFGFVEVGTVTPKPQPGNEGPRLYRLVEDHGVINRFGFNSEGHEAVGRRLARISKPAGIIGVNVGANKDSNDRIADYAAGVRALGPLADYITINVSSPNTPGLRSLQSNEYLPRLIEEVMKAKVASPKKPIFLKVSPDLADSEIAAVAKASLDGGIDALIISNTTVTRPEGLQSQYRTEGGGLSGRPLRPLAMQALRAFRSAVGSKLPLIGAGGIESAEDAYERIRAGASLLQLYTALAYKGPNLVSEINKGLIELLNRDAFSNIGQAIGADYVNSPAFEAA